MIYSHTDWGAGAEAGVEGEEDRETAEAEKETVGEHIGGARPGAAQA